MKAIGSRHYLPLDVWLMPLALSPAGLAVAAPAPRNHLRGALDPYLRMHANNPWIGIPWGGGGAGKCSTGKQTDLSIHRLSGLLLVSCGRPRVVFRFGYRPPDESLAREYLGQPREAPGHRPRLSTRRSGHERTGWLVQ